MHRSALVDGAPEQVIQYLSSCQWDIAVAKIKDDNKTGVGLQLRERYPVGKR